MSEPNTSTEAERTFDDVVKGGEVFTEARAFKAILLLTRSVAALHAAGKLHQSIVGHATINSNGDVCLRPPPAEVILDGAFPDLAMCPPELHGAGSLTLPCDIEPTRNRLREAGFSFDPRRIDLYQLGVVLCQAVTGEPIECYLKSPKVKGSLSPRMRQIIDGALGFDSDSMYSSAEMLAAGLEACIDTAVKEQDTDVLKPKGEYDTDAGTPIGGRVASQVKGAPIETALPFRSLGHYEILEQIGQGGMGDVYKGYERSLDRVVAIKVLPSDFARHPEFLERFRAEATAIASITHPNVIQIHFIGEDAGHHYFAMQFINGGSLADVLHDRGRVSMDEACAIVAQVLAGLSAAHHAGIIHRDIKPGNILIDRKSGRAVVADFGLVKSISRTGKLTATGVVMGTVDYIAPEQAQGHAVDARTDLYSVGALAYQLLTGKLPFEADSPTAMIFQHVYKEPPSLLSRSSEVPKRLAAVVHRLLAKSPDDRFQSAEETIVALRTALTRSSKVVGPMSSGHAPKSATAIIAAPQFFEPAPLPYDLDREAPLSWWARQRKQLRDALRRRTPEFVKQLQSTQQQVDGALDEYEDRRDQLQSLVDEAEEVLVELRAQIVATRDAALAIAARAADVTEDTQARLLREEQQSLDNSAAELEDQVSEQEQELETMRLRLAQVNATLSKLRSQRDLLDARLKVARAQAGLEMRKPKRSLASRLGWLAGISAAMVVASLLVVFFRPPQGYFAKRVEVPATATSSLPQSVRGEFGQSVMKLDGEPTTVAIGDGYIVIGQGNGEVAITNLSPDATLQWANQVVTGLDPVQRVAAMPSERMFAVAIGKSIQLWFTGGPSGRREHRLLNGHETTVTEMVFSSDSTLLLSGSQDGTLITWEVARGEEVSRSNASNWVESLAWSKDRSRVLIGARVSGADSLSLWSYFDQRNEHLFGTRKRETHAVAFSPLEDLAYSMSSNAIQVRDAANGNTIREFGTGLVKAAFAPRVQRAWTADSRGTVTLWDISDGSIIQSFPAHKQSVRSVAISRDGLRAVSVSADGEIHAWLLPDTPPPKDQVSVVTVQYPIASAAVFPDAEQAITNTKGGVALWELANNRQLLAYDLKSPVTSIAISITGDRMIYGTAAENGKAIVGVRQVSNQLLRDDIQCEGHTEDVSSVSISVDNRHAVSSSTDGRVHVWDLRTGHSLAHVDIGAAVTSTALVRSGSDVFIAAEDGVVRRWRWEGTDAPEAWAGHSAAVRSLAISSDGTRVASAGDDGRVIVWNATSGEKVATLTDDEGAVSAIGISMHGMAVLAGSANGVVHLWDVTAGRKVQQFTGHAGRIVMVRFSLDGSKAVSGSDDETIRVWKLPLIIQ